MDDVWKPNVLVLGPGGAKGFLQLGSLEYLQKKNFLDEVHTIVGCSIGAIISLLILCGYKFKEISDLGITLDLFKDIRSVNITNILDTAGLIDTEFIDNLIEGYVKDKLGYVPTLKQLYKETEIVWYIVATKLGEGPVYLSHETHPDINVVEAVMLSSNIPGLFSKRKYDCYTWIDGAFSDPYPIEKVDDGKNRVLGIYTVEKGETYSTGSNVWYLSTSFRYPIRELRRKTIKYSTDKCKHLRLEALEQGLDYTEEQRKKMINDGFKQTEKQFPHLINPEFIATEIPILPDIEDNEDS